MKKLEKRPVIFDGCAAFLCAFLFMYLGQVVLSLIIEGTHPNASEFMGTATCQYIFMAINQICMVGAVFLYGKISGVNPVKVSGLKRGLSVGQGLMLVPIGLLCVAAFLPLAQIFLMFLDVIGYKGVSTIPSPADVGGLFLALFIIAALPAIGEEFVFRGNVAPGLSAKGYGFAIAVSSLLFGLFHGSALQLVHQTLLGAVMCYVYFATGSFWAAAILHFVNNALALSLDFILLKATGSSAVAITLNPWLMVLIFIVCSLAAVYVLLAALSFYTDLCKEKKGVETSGLNPFKAAFKIYCRAFTPKGFKTNAAELKNSLDSLSFAEKEIEQTETVQAPASEVSTTDGREKPLTKKQLLAERQAEEDRRLQRELEKEKKRRDKRADIMSLVVAFAIVGAVWIFQFVQALLPERKQAPPAPEAGIEREYEY